MDLIAFSESMNIHIKSQIFNKSSMMMGRKSQWEKAAIQWNDLHCVFELCKKRKEMLRAKVSHFKVIRGTLRHYFG